MRQESFAVVWTWLFKALGHWSTFQYNRYKAVSRRDEKGRLKRWVVGWVGEFGQDRERHLDTWSLVEMLRCRRYGVRQTLLQQQGNSSVSLQHSITYHGTHHGEPHICLPCSPYLPPFLPVQGGLNLKSRCGWACWSITRCRRTQKVIFSKN